MNYKICPHYNEMVNVLAEGKELDDISFKLEDIEGCDECGKDEQGVCNLWISLTFVEDMKSQVGVEAAKVTIDTLDEQFSKVVQAMLFSMGTGEADDNAEDKDPEE